MLYGLFQTRKCAGLSNMTTYPLTFPAVGVRSAQFRLMRVVAASVSEFTLKQQVYQFPGEQWQGDIVLPPLSRSDAGLVQAFLAELRGSFGTFLYGDPMALAFGKLGAGGGSPLVDGADQTGNSLDIDDCSASITDWLKAGDYFQLGTGSTSRLYMIAADVDTDGAGSATLTFNPALRAAPANDAVVTITDPMGVMRLDSNVAVWQADRTSLTNINFSYREHIDE